MDYILLGLLLLSNRTIYQLRDRINKGINLMYSSSMGSIQASIKKLLAGKFIVFDETIEKGKYKKIYSITEAGRDFFYTWVNEPQLHHNIKNPELTKLYFMGFAEKKNRAKNIEVYIESLKKQYKVLTAICEEARRIQQNEIKEDIAKFQLQTALYGRDMIMFNIEWYENLLKTLTGDEKNNE